jgi:PqqD family protein of HPr-rel-A system
LVWRAASKLIWREWDEELVVYNDEDGNTHHLGPLGRDLLQTLIAKHAGMETSELVDLLIPKLSEGDSTTASSSQLEDALEELDRLGLISRDPA